MSKYLQPLLALILLLTSAASKAALASISSYCAKTTSTAEQIVCGNQTLLAFSQLPDAMLRIDAMRVSAEAGDIGAQIKLGLVYLFGRGVEQDSVRSLAWFIKAADNGDTVGKALVKAMNQDNLTALLTNGLPSPKPAGQMPDPLITPTGEEVRQSDQDDILKQILPLLRIDLTSPGIKGLVLNAVITINEDGSLKAPLNHDAPWTPNTIIPDDPQASPYGKSYRRVAMENFVMALRLCQPLKLPPGYKGSKWMRINLSVDQLADAAWENAH